MKVIGHILPLDGIADEEELAVAQLLGNIEGADGRNQNHGNAGDDAGHTQGNDHPPQDRQASAAQVPGRLQQSSVQLGED